MKKEGYHRYQKYTSADPFREPNRNSIFESKGMPNILKNIGNEIIVDIVGNEKDFSKKYDFSFDNFNLSLIVDIIDDSRNDIYAISKYGNLNNLNKLVDTEIKIYVNISNYDANNLKRVLIHELLHIYEVFNRIKGKTKKDLQWQLNNFLIKIRDKYNDKLIDDFIYLIYLSLDHGINARIAESYSILIDKRISNKNALISELYQINFWKYSQLLIDFNYQNYKINFDLLLSFFTELNTLMSNKFKKLNFNLYNIPINDKDCLSIIKQWSILFRNKGDYIQDKLLKLIDEVINDVKMIESCYIELYNDKYILKFNKYLERNSKIFKLNR